MSMMTGNSFFSMIEGGIIYRIENYQNQRTAIGYTSNVYQELEATAQEYYNKLVEVGIIVPPKSQEEINAEMQKALSDSQQLNMKLLAIIENMEGANNDKRPNTKDSSDVPTVKSKGNSNGSARATPKGTDAGDSTE